MDPTLAIFLPIFLALLAASALCSASETALFSLTHADRQLLANRSPNAARIIERLLASPSSLLVTILLMNVVVNTIMFVLASVLGTRYSGAVAVIIGTTTLLSTILLGEVIPKTLAVAHRMFFARLLAPIVLVADRILAPIRFVTERLIILPLTRIAVPRRAGPTDAQAIAELSELLASETASGIIDPHERRMLADVLRLRTLRVRDAMTPRREIVWLSAEDSGATLLSNYKQHGHSRYPLAAAHDPKTIVGVIRAHDVLPAIGAAASPDLVQIQAFAQTVHFIPDRARLDQLLDRFREWGADVVICVDELGEVSGMIQIDDVIRELGVGPVDVDAPERQIKLVGLNTWELPGRLSLRHLVDFLAALKISLPDEERQDIGTVAGLILSKLGHIARVGDDASFGSFRLIVQAVSGRSVLRVWLILTHQSTTSVPQSADKIDEQASSPRREESSRERAQQDLIADRDDITPENPGEPAPSVPPASGGAA